jgi:hypothetical protein
MRHSGYFGRAARIFLICLGLGAFLFVLKSIAYSGYLAHGEWRRDGLIWAIVSVALSVLSPALEKIGIGRKDSG